jgi:RNA polymerase sigma factor (sigma-70 family)
MYICHEPRHKQMIHIDDCKDVKFSSLYKKYIDDLYGYGMSFGFGHNLVLDAIQDVFYNLYIKLSSTEITDEKQYLLKSLKNRLLDIYLRREARNTVHIGDMNFSFSTEISIMDEIIAGEEQERLVRIVKSLLDSLTDRQREAVYLRYMQELEYEEIGEILNMTGESVRKLVYRAIHKLRHQEDGFKLLIYLLCMLN